MGNGESHRGRGNWKWETENGGWESGNGKWEPALRELGNWEMDNGKWETWKWETGNGKLAYGKWKIGSGRLCFEMWGTGKIGNGTQGIGKLGNGKWGTVFRGMANEAFLGLGPGIENGEVGILTHISGGFLNPEVFHEFTCIGFLQLGQFLLDLGTERHDQAFGVMVFQVRGGGELLLSDVENHQHRLL